MGTVESVSVVGVRRGLTSRLPPPTGRQSVGT